MTPKAALNARKKKILQKSVQAILQSEGFIHKGIVYRRKVGNIQHVVDIQALSWTELDEVHFTINCGVFVPGVWTVYTTHADATAPSVVDCTIGTRPGTLATPKRGDSWYLRTSDTPEQEAAIIEDIRFVIQQIVLPFFARFPNEAAVASFLSAPRTKADQQVDPACESKGVVFAGIIWDLLGECDKCTACMAQAAEMAKGKRVQAKIEKFAREYVCGKLPRS